MPQKLGFFNIGYLPAHLSNEVKELFLSFSILNFAASSVSLFEPIYLYTLGWSIKQIVLFFLAVYGLYFFIMPFGGWMARNKGYEHCIFYSSFFLIGYYVSLFALPQHPFFVIAAVVCLALQKMLYWPGFHSDFARYGRSEERGREISNLIVISSIVSVATPLAGGAIVAVGGFKPLFIFAASLILISNFPLFLTKEPLKSKDFFYKDAYKRLFRKDYRRQFLSFLGFGEEILLLLVWPVFIFTVLGKVFNVGVLVSFSVLISSLVTLFLGRVVDQKRREGVLRTGAIFYSLANFFRILVSGTLGIFFVDLIGRTSKNMVSIPLIAMTYDRASQTSVVKTVVHFEMSIVVGKILAMLFILVLLDLFGENFTPLFILSGLVTWFYAFAKEYKGAERP